MVLLVVSSVVSSVLAIRMGTEVPSAYNSIKISLSTEHMETLMHCNSFVNFVMKTLYVCMG